MLMILSFVKPALSQAPADLGMIPATVNLDWFYMPIYPVLNHVPGLTVWIVLIVATAFLMLLPWMPPGKRVPVAVVNLDNCNGCSRCAADCPFSAITMEPRSDGSAYEKEAVVIADNCTSCGICVGSCPTATPFRTKSELSPGIELPQDPIKLLRENTIAASEKLSGDDRVIVYGCQNSLDPKAVTDANVGVVTMPCIAMLPPSFIDFVLSRKLADGVFLTGCRDGDCTFRLGIKWTDARIAGERDPMLRKRADQNRVQKYWAGLTRRKKFFNELSGFRGRLKTLALEKAEQSGVKENSEENNA
jgi:ferredoxin